MSAQWYHFNVQITAFEREKRKEKRERTRCEWKGVASQGRGRYKCVNRKKSLNINEYKQMFIHLMYMSVINNQSLVTRW